MMALQYFICIIMGPRIAINRNKATAVAAILFMKLNIPAVVTVCSTVKFFKLLIILVLRQNHNFHEKYSVAVNISGMSVIILKVYSNTALIMQSNLVIIESNGPGKLL